MSQTLTHAEEKYLVDLLSWDEQRRPAETIALRVALGVGGAAIVVAAILTALDLRDEVIRAVLVPGVLAGLFLVVISLLGKARVQDRHRMASIARTLLDTT